MEPICQAAKDCVHYVMVSVVTCIIVMIQLKG